MQELNKTIDINFKVGLAKWVLAQPLWFPLLLFCSGVCGITFLFGIPTFIIGCGISLIIAILIILNGLESGGISYFSLIVAYLGYQTSKKILLKKEIVERTELVLNDCVVTKDYVYNIAEINSYEYTDITDKNSFNNDLEELVTVSSKDYLTYTMNTELSDMKREDINNYLDSMKIGISQDLNNAYLAIAQDIVNLVDAKEFSIVTSNLTTSIPTDRKESLNLQVKTLNNELQLLERKSINSYLTISQKKIN